MQPRFLTVGDRQVHYHTAGEGPPVVLLHPSPLSGKAVLPLATELAKHFRVFALDTPGYGLSDAPATRPESLDDYLEGFAATFDALGLGPVCLYGAATGAQFAVAFARRYPQRVSLMILDSAGHFDSATTEAMVTDYFPPLQPRADGSHLATLWHMVHDLFVFFPWCDARPAARLARDLPPVTLMQDYLLDYLRAGDRYDWAYRPAFFHERVEYAREVTVPSLLVRWPSSVILAETDALIRHGLPDNYEVLRVGPTPAERHEGIAEAVRARYGATTAAQPETSAPAPASRVSSSYIHVDGLRLHLRSRLAGAGKPLLALHGAGSSASAMERWLLTQREPAPLICVDLPGHGESTARTAVAGTLDPGVAGLAALIDNVLGELGIDSCDIVAEPLGACIAQELGRRRPGLVGALRPLGASPSATPPLADWLVRHIPDLSPALDGTHLFRAWHHARHAALWSPWWQRTRTHALASPLPPPAELHARVVDIMKAGPAYAAAVRAEYEYYAGS